MKLRFWKKDKKIPKIKDLVNAHEIHNVQSKSTQDIIEDSYVEVDYISQCFGKLKSGARCSRIVDNAEYCWQHKKE